MIKNIGDSGNCSQSHGLRGFQCKTFQKSASVDESCLCCGWHSLWCWGFLSQVLARMQAAGTLCPSSWDAPCWKAPFPAPSTRALQLCDLPCRMHALTFGKVSMLILRVTWTEILLWSQCGSCNRFSDIIYDTRLSTALLKCNKGENRDEMRCHFGSRKGMGEFKGEEKASRVIAALLTSQTKPGQYCSYFLLNLPSSSESVEQYGMLLFQSLSFFVCFSPRNLFTCPRFISFDPHNSTTVATLHSPAVQSILSRPFSSPGFHTVNRLNLSCQK